MLSRLLGSAFRHPLDTVRGKRVRTLIARGEAHRARANVEAAINAFDSAVALEPNNARINFLAAAARIDGKRHTEAQHYLERSIALDPRCGESYIYLGNLRQLAGDTDVAESLYKKALELEPTSALAHYNLALLFQAQGRKADAIRHLRDAYGTSAQLEIARSLVIALLDCAEYDEALAIAQESTRLNPHSPQSWIGLGLAHQKSHRAADALECYDRAAKYGADDADFHTNRGIVLHELARIGEALNSFDAALARRPEYPLARFHRGVACLLTGDYNPGWRDYETRLVSADLPRRPTVFPRWQGEPLTGRTILAYGEQGLGDQIMFASCLPDLIKSGGRCVVECDQRLVALIQRSFPQVSVRDSLSGSGETEQGKSTIDFEIPFGSLPLHFRATTAAFPRHDGYVRAAPESIAKWRSVLAALGPSPKIGLSWRGGTHNTRSPLRSIPLGGLLPSLSAAGAEFVSLQYTAGAAEEIEAARRKYGIRIHHWQEAIDDYDETAALLCALDLTVTVCTSIVHLAGALGVPAWVLTPYCPEWRYGLSGDTMPWYPSVRMFRQTAPGHWDSVLESVNIALASWTRSEVAA